MEEYFFTCPVCWQKISMLVDTSAGSQNYVEDCEVCCRPLHISCDAEDGDVTFFDAQFHG